MIFAEKPLIVRILLRPPEGEVSTLLLSLLRKWAAWCSCSAYCCGLRHSIPCAMWSIVEALIAGLCILAVTPLLSLWMTDIRDLYPGYLLWDRSAVRLAMAALLYWLRPQHVRWEPIGNF
jgi:hypothetical protein